jgi:hypothetical protein
MINHSSTSSPRVLLKKKKEDKMIKLGGHRPKPTETGLTKTIIRQTYSISREAISGTAR